MGIHFLRLLAVGLFLGLCSASKWQLTVPGGGSVVVEDNPWSLAFYNDKGQQVLNQMSGGGTLGFGLWVGKDFSDRIYEGYSWRIGRDIIWFDATEVVSSRTTSKSANYVLATTDRLGAKLYVTIQSENGHISMQVSARGGLAIKANRLGIGFLTSDDDGYYGFGERFNAQNQRGNRLYCWAEDGGWSFDLIDGARIPKVPTETYAPMPWFVSPNKYGFLVDTTYRTNWELDTADLHTLAKTYDNGFYLEVESTLATYRFFSAESTVDVVKSFTDYTGRSLIPPLWQFGPWNQFATEIEGLDKKQAMQYFIDNDIPYSVHLDALHFFPQGKQKNKYEQILDITSFSKSVGLRPLAYFNSMVDTSYQPAYNECVANNYFMKNEDDSVYVFKYKGAYSEPFHCSLLDFTNPGTKDWYQSQMLEAIQLGYSGFMYDYGEYVDSHNVAYDKSTGAEHHNKYPLVYQKTAFEFFKSLDSNPSDAYAPDYNFYVRSGYVGTQKYVWNHWTGDPMSDWSDASGLPAQISAQLNIGLSGVPFTGSDIGGFVWFVPPTLELWVRWSQLGLFSPTMHIQGGGTSLAGIDKTHIHDWQRGAFIWRKLAKLRMSLLPYIYTLAHDAHESGTPLMRHHLLDFSDDVIALRQQYQYCFGKNFLVAPVVRNNVRSQSVYLPTLPAGEHWIDVSSNLAYSHADGRHRIGYSEYIKGGKDHVMTAPLEIVPFLVRSGSIIPTYDPSIDTVSDAEAKDVVTLAHRKHILHLWVWPRADGYASGSAYDGSSYSLAPHDAANQELGFSLTIVDPAQRTLVSQIVLPVTRMLNGLTVCSSTADACDTLTKYKTWVELVDPDTDVEGWAYDLLQQTLWIRHKCTTGASTIEFNFDAVKLLM